MNGTAIMKTSIMDELSLVPEARLADIKNYLDSLLRQAEVQRPRKQSLAGMWANAGFEKIADLEGEVRQMQRETQDQILKKAV